MEVDWFVIMIAISTILGILLTLSELLAASSCQCNALYQVLLYECGVPEPEEPIFSVPTILVDSSGTEIGQRTASVSTG